ncbi:MAG: glycoside hydrolase family 2 TIM barrel-domain containing protein, partial [Clostridia bacterium]
RARFKALKEHGFNFYRYHTHVPTEEELSVADEMGIMVDAEMGLVTNFHKMAPVERAFEMLSAYVRATRNHPALVVYCLGNEGSQLMVEIETERNKARIGYDLIKKNTQNQLAMTCFGNQGELPELENDIETPHLWSDTFLAAYDGLSRVPWDVLANTTLNRPCVIHEYGKFGVWPDMREEEAIHSLNGVKKDFASQARLSLTEKGVSHLEELFLRNSRKLNLLCTKIILEEARRQPYVSGYALWSFFRGCNRNTGICDDMGVLYDGSPAAFAEGCNGKVALMMDRGFQQRAIPCYVPQQIDITLSNFSRQTVAGQLCVMLMCGETVISENTVAALGVPGSTGVAMRFICSVPGEYHGKKLTLAARLNDAHNEWD